jgi:phosphomannomutase/phosphoglucomutase
MILNPKIFRAYDIRGEAFIDYDEDGFCVTAAAYGKYIAKKHHRKNPKIFVSGDGRTSMSKLFPAIITGLNNAHCEVTWGGAIPTPMNYFMLHEGGFDAAIQISASHNPPKDNGLKFTDTHGAVCGDEIQEILQMTKNKDSQFKNKQSEPKHTIPPTTIFEKYLQKLQKITPNQSPKTIILDSGNAIPGTFYPEIFEAFGHRVERLYCDLDATFPNHQPDPERVENLQDLLHALKEKKADYGLAFDGDGDRLGVVLENGTILSADKILYCLAVDFLSRNPGEKIVIDAMSSRTLIQKLEAKGATVIVSPTGHSYIHEKMEEVGARFGGEQSGHFMFGENFYGHDDAMLAGLRFIHAIESHPELITDVTDNWPALLEFSEKITVVDEEKFNIVEKVKADVLRDYPEAITVDGVRVDWDQGEWAIVRCSNTSPKIAVRLEMTTPERLKEMETYFTDLLQKHNA